MCLYDAVSYTSELRSLETLRPKVGPCSGGVLLVAGDGVTTLCYVLAVNVLVFLVPCYRFLWVRLVQIGLNGVAFLPSCTSSS